MELSEYVGAIAGGVAAHSRMPACERTIQMATSRAKFGYLAEQFREDSEGKRNVLANEEDINSAQIELVVVWERGKPFVCRMHSRIELQTLISQDAPDWLSTYHYCLALILEDMT